MGRAEKGGDFNEALELFLGTSIQSIGYQIRVCRGILIIPMSKMEMRLT